MFFPLALWYFFLTQRQYHQHPHGDQAMGADVQGGIGSQEINFDDVLSTRRTPDEYVRVPENRRVDATLLQRSRVRGQSRQAVLFNGHFLEWVEYRGRRPLRTRVINLAFVAPQPRLRQHVAWSWWVAAAMVALASAAAFWFSGAESGAVLGGLAVIVAMAAARRCHRRLVFRTRYGGIAVFELYAGWLRHAATDQFVAQLQDRCSEAERILPRSRERLAAEMAEHRRLMKAGCLTEARYAMAKKRLFSRFSKPVAAPPVRR